MSTNHLRLVIKTGAQPKHIDSSTESTDTDTDTHTGQNLFHPTLCNRFMVWVLMCGVQYTPPSILWSQSAQFYSGPCWPPKMCNGFFWQHNLDQPLPQKVWSVHVSRWSAVDSTHRWEDGKDKEKNQPAAAQICSTNSTWGAL